MSTGAFPDSFNKEARERLRKRSENFIWDNPYLWKISDDKIFRQCMPENDDKISDDKIIPVHVEATLGLNEPNARY